MKTTGANTRNETPSKPIEGKEIEKAGATAAEVVGTQEALSNDSSNTTNDTTSVVGELQSETTSTAATAQTTEAKANPQPILEQVKANTEPPASVSENAVEAIEKTIARIAALPNCGPKALCEIRHGGKIYAPGERLPDDLDEDTEDELEAIGAIFRPEILN